MLLVIDNYDSFTYNLVQALAEFESEICVKRNDKITVQEIIALKPRGIILSPGPGRPDDAGICVALVNELSGSIPILGVCLGHQAIATAFESQVIKSPQAMHGKSSLIFHRRTRLYKQLPLPFYAGRYHSLIVDRQAISSALELEAESEDGVVMGIKHREHPTYGVQFHPESILSLHGKIILKNFVGICEQQSC